VGGKGPVNPDQTYFEFQVEKPAMAKESNPTPTYPSMLESAGVEGEVLVQFVIDTLGKADMNTFKVLKSSNDLFTSSIKNVLPRLRFYPAETGGRKVKELVQYPFSFSKPKQ
jgi:protein TonB